ncbi:MAG: type II secretion system F family protein, partial [Proteobacteria bacterium]|nr:type II secretion system F family protein [Pseudomonadota bacterium]
HLNTFTVAYVTVAEVVTAYNNLTEAQKDLADPILAPLLFPVSLRNGFDEPIIGPILQKAAIARYARTLATMFAAGVPLVEALESVAGATGNIVYEIGVLKIRDEVSTGQRLQQAMENVDLFPNMVIQMIAVGEESGSLDAMSAKVADFYEEDVDNAVDNLSSLLEPMIMAILGVLVGGLVIAMYLPIFKMGAVI